MQIMFLNMEIKISKL